MIIEQTTEKKDIFDIYNLSDEDDIIIIREDNYSSLSSSSNNSSNNSLNKSSSDLQESHNSVNFILLEINSKIFELPFDIDNNHLNN